VDPEYVAAGLDALLLVELDGVEDDDEVTVAFMLSKLLDHFDEDPDAAAERAGLPPEYCRSVIVRMLEQGKTAGDLRRMIRKAKAEL
jgi:hypothetical protein